MGLFKPPKRMLEFICKNEEELLISYEIYPFGSLNKMYDLQCLFETGLFERICNVYREDGLALNEEGRRRLDFQGIHNVIGESFKNWIGHSSENSNLLIGCFFGSLGIGFGFKDSGEFFKNPEIKEQIENKILFEKFDENSRGDNCKGRFNEHIYPCADFLEVDTEQGIFYIAQMKENIIAPEGECSSNYCWNKRKEKGLILD